MAALGGGRLTLANQGSLYHVSWRPRLPDAFEWAPERDSFRRTWTQLEEGGLKGFSPRVKLYNSSPFAS